MKAKRFGRIAVLFFLLIVLVYGCGEDVKDDTGQGGDAETIEQEAQEEPEAAAEEESEPEIDVVEETTDEPQYTPCGSNSDCSMAYMCVMPGMCVPATGSVKGRFEVAIPGELNGANYGGSGPGYAFGDYRGEGVYLGSEVRCEDDVIDRELGFCIGISILEDLAANVRDFLELYIAKDAIMSNTRIEFSSGKFKGIIGRQRTEQGQTVREEWAEICGGYIEFAYAVPEPLDRVIARFQFDLCGLVEQ